MKKVVVGLLLALALCVPRPPLGATVYNPGLLQWLHLETPLSAAYIPSAIKSITAISTGTTQTVAVTKANSILFWNAVFGVGGGGISGFSRATITNDTTVTATGSTWKGTLVEFYGNFVKSEGCGTITLGSGVQSNTAAITAVVVAKTIVASDGFTSSNNVDNMASAPAAVLTNTTTITASSSSAPTGGFSTVVAYCYLELR